MAIDWEKLANDTGKETDEHFWDKISGLTRLHANEVESLINDTGISKEDLTAVLKEVKDATKSNLDKATAISNVNKSVDLLVGIAEKLL
jgi:hypothetical protein